MEVTERPDGITIVNDAYNANPESMRAALKALVAMGRGAEQRRTWAVIGEMRELGDISVDEHDAIAARRTPGCVQARRGGRRCAAGAPRCRPRGIVGEESAWVPDVDAAIALLREQVSRVTSCSSRHRARSVSRPSPPHCSRTAVMSHEARRPVRHHLGAHRLHRHTAADQAAAQARLFPGHRVSTEGEPYPSTRASAAPPPWWRGDPRRHRARLRDHAPGLVDTAVAVRAARALSRPRPRCRRCRRRLPQDLPPPSHRPARAHQAHRQAIVALTFAIMALQFPNAVGRRRDHRDLLHPRHPLVLPAALYVLWVWFLVTATTNGVTSPTGWTASPPAPPR